jgi:histidinol-phosphate aminotransferase
MSDKAGQSATIPNAIFKAMGPPGSPSIERDLAATGIAATQIRRMNLNESPYPPSAQAIAAMQAACSTVNYYPDPKWRDLVAAISGETGIAENRIVLGNGSDELIVNAGKIALNPGDEMLVPVPSFPGYDKSAEINQAALVRVPVRQDGAPDVDAMAAAITDKTRIVYCATPNNPTGGLIGTAELERLSQAVPASALFIVDEAYYEFGRHAGGDDHLQMLQARQGPWVSFRTFSKAFGLAGIRVGYALCGSDDLANAFQQARSVFNVNAVAQAAALAALRDPDHTQWILTQTAEERRRLDAGLRRLGCRPFPSVGNFIAAATDRPAADIVAALAARGIMISRLMAPGYQDYLRITVSTADDTDALLAALSDILAA